MPRLFDIDEPHFDLVICGLFSAWIFAPYGAGFLLLRAVRKRTERFTPATGTAEFQQLQIARVLAQVSIFLFFTSWFGIIVLGWGHGDRQKAWQTEQKVMQSRPAATEI